MDNDTVLALQLRQEEIARCRALPYPQYLKLPWWDFKRYQALKRAGRVCELCRQAEARQVHHTTYERLGCEKPDDLVALCKDCHQHITANGLDRISRGDLLKRRREIMHSPEFQRVVGRLEY